MRKFTALLLSFSLMTASVSAGEITVILDGSEVEFSAQEPVVSEGRTLIPLRGVFEQLGWEISWENDTKTAVFSNSGGDIIAITVGSDSFTMNGEEIPLDVPADIINSTMMLPLRAVGEAAGLEVTWNSETKTVNLLSKTYEAEPLMDSEEGLSSEEFSEENIPEETLNQIKASAEVNVKLNEFFCLIDMYKKYFEPLSSPEEVSFYSSFLTQEDFKERIDSIPAMTEKFTAAFDEIQYSTEYIDSGLKEAFLNSLEKINELSRFVYGCSFEEENSDLSDLTEDEEAEELKRMTAAKGAAYGDFAVELGNYATTVASANSLSEDYNFPHLDRAALSDEVVELTNEITAYCEEISYFLFEEIPYAADFDDLSDVVDEDLGSDAKALRDKLNSTYTPKSCMTAKYTLLKCCDLLEEAEEAASNPGFELDDYENEFFIEYYYKAVSALGILSVNINEAFISSAE